VSVTVTRSPCGSVVISKVDGQSISLFRDEAIHVAEALFPELQRHVAEEAELEVTLRGL
jgi:hypothetical protein